MNSKDAYRFALVAHSPEIIRRVQEGQGRTDCEIYSRLTSFDEAVPEARRLLASGYEVILCHGGTGGSIVREVGHSVVAIQKTDMDVVKALQKAKSLHRDVALTIFAEEAVDVATIQNLLQIRIHSIPYSSKEELIYGVKMAFDQGLRAVVGGGISKRLMEGMGGTGIIVEPGFHCIQQAIDQAVAIAKSKREEAVSRDRLVAILRLVDEGTLCVDNYRNIVFSNDKAKKLLKIRPSQDMEAGLSRHLDKLGLNEVLNSGESQLNMIKTITGKRLIVNALPVTLHARMRGAVALFRDVESVQKINHRIREDLRSRGLVARHGIEDIKGRSPKIAGMLRKISKYAPNDASVYIHGETGSGKELVAQAMHNLSTRRDKPFVAVNCSALSESLLESELFGYEEGAFTGAKRGGKIGLFELADKGTIFLDEIGDVSHSLQLRLLRVLEAKQLRRVGGDRIVSIETRVISASHKELSRLVLEDRFRMDLFYRLAMMQIHVPPLRERLEDVPVILQDLLAAYGRGKEILTPAVLEAVAGYAWPGNIRELLALFESYLVLLDKGRGDEALFFELFRERAMPVGEMGADNGAAMGAGSLKDRTEDFRRTVVRKVLAECAGNRTLAAKKLGVSYNTLWRIAE